MGSKIVSKNQEDGWERVEMNSTENVSYEELWKEVWLLRGKVQQEERYDYTPEKKSRRKRMVSEGRDTTRQPFHSLYNVIRNRALMLSKEGVDVFCKERPDKYADVIQKLTDRPEELDLPAPMAPNLDLIAKQHEFERDKAESILQFWEEYYLEMCDSFLNGNGVPHFLKINKYGGTQGFIMPVPNDDGSVPVCPLDGMIDKQTGKEMDFETKRELLRQEKMRLLKVLAVTHARKVDAFNRFKEMERI